MKESYISRDFRETTAKRFPSRAEELNAAFGARLQALRAENAGASKEKTEHLERQILPGIAAYETLQTVMPKDEAWQAIHGYVEQKARRAHKYLTAMLRVPGLYRLVPGHFRQINADGLRPRSGLRGGGAANRQDHMAHRHDEVPVSRHLHTIRLPRAVPLLLRQRRYQL